MPNVMAAATLSSPKRHSGQHSWRHWAPSWLGSPKEDSWASGFPRSLEVHDPDGLPALDLFRWLAAALQLSEEDIDGLQPCRQLMHMQMARQVFGRFTELKAFRTHLNAGSDSAIKKRVQMVEHYLDWCMTLRRDSPESYVAYLDRVASVHNRGRNRVPCSHLLVGLAIAQDVFMRHLCASSANKEELQRSACAVGKIIWIQAVFFARHTTRRRVRRPFLLCAAVLLVVISAHRRLASVRSLAPRAPAALLDLAVATVGAAALQRILALR